MTCEPFRAPTWEARSNCRLSVKRISLRRTLIFLPEYLAQVRQTLADPDQVRRSVHVSTARLFYRWFESVRRGKYVVVVVVSEAAPKERHWIITAYIARRLANGEVEWSRS